MVNSEALMTFVQGESTPFSEYGVAFVQVRSSQFYLDVEINFV